MITYLHENMLSQIEGSTIAVVYVFQGDNTSSFQHYDPWKSDVISDWLNAIQELHCMPFILDVRTFAQKALNGTLPHIDYVVNLNAGTKELSVLGLIPSICSFINVPCIPSNAVSTLVGENKYISNLLAYALNTIVPKEIESTDPNGIFRPLNLGSSRGVQKTFPSQNIPSEYLYQEFIPGFDMTIPFMYNPLSEQVDILPPIMYCPDIIDTKWFLGEKEKDSHIGYKKCPVCITDEAQKHFLKLVKAFGINTYCRIDTRVFCKDVNEMKSAAETKITLERINFIEINPLPTIKNSINFHTSFQSIEQDTPLGNCIEMYNSFFPSHSFVGFLLSSSIISYLKAKH